MYKLLFLFCMIPACAFANKSSNYTDGRGMFDIKNGMYNCTSHTEKTGTDEISRGRVEIQTKKAGNGKLVVTVDLGEKIESPSLPIATQTRDSVSYSLMLGSDDNGIAWSVKSVKDEGLGLMFMRKRGDDAFVFITDSCNFIKNK